ncbi:GNAT family N-acetyltransferase [Aestuariirhabdus sp. LZHN29]|uniref:GNAT family N-acetyltransferase n=1 Tax=Aestuariirhabdus sp. LZHN29 TaxID=3417462 RepID=UPI003CF62E08
MAKTCSDSAIRIQPYQLEDAPALMEVFHRAVHAIDGSLYSAAEREAWAPTPPDGIWWRERLRTMEPEVAWSGAQIAGFASLLVTVAGASGQLVRQGHIDCLYTRPDFQRQGVAAALYSRCTERAIERACTVLTVDASRAAQPFFHARGFRVVNHNRIALRGQRLANCTMSRAVPTEVVSR